MTFASAERAFLSPPDPHSCERCEDNPDMSHDDCLEAAADEYDDAMAARAERRREEEWAAWR